MSVGYYASESDLNDFDAFLKQFDQECLGAVGSFHIWPIDAEGYSLFICPQRLPMDVAGKQMVMTGDNAVAKFDTDVAREAFIAAISRLLDERKIKYTVDRDTGPRLMDMWREARESATK